MHNASTQNGKVNAYILRAWLNGTKHNIPNTNWTPKPTDCGRLAQPHARVCTFFLVLGRLCLSSICVHAKAKTKSQQTSNGRKRCKVHIKRHKADNCDRHGKHRYKDVSKQGRRQTSKTANKQAKRQTSKRWCPRGTNVGLDQMSITSFVLNHG